MERWQLRPARDHGLSLRDRLASTRREPGLIEGLGQRTWAWWVQSYVRCWHRLQVSGREHLPTATPFVLVANPTSHLDSLVLASVVPWRTRRALYPIAAGDVFFESPPRALLSAVLLNALPMQRGSMGRHALADLRARLVEDACSFILFPEGTRSATGDMQRFKPGLGMLVAATDVPVVPCFLRGAYQAWPRTARWPRPRGVTVSIGEPLFFRDIADDRDGWKQVASTTEAAVRALSVTVV